MAVADDKPTGLIVRLAAQRPGTARTMAVPPGTRLGRAVTRSGVYKVTVTDGSSLQAKLQQIKSWPGELLHHACALLMSAWFLMCMGSANRHLAWVQPEQLASVLAGSHAWERPSGAANCHNGPCPCSTERGRCGWHLVMHYLCVDCLQECCKQKLIIR